MATRRSTSARQLFGAGEGWSGVESPEASASARRIVLCGDGVALMNSCRARLRLGAMQEQQCREASAFDLGAIRSGSLWGQRFRPRFLRVARGAMGGDWRICAVCWFFGASGARLRLGWCGDANHQRLRSQPIRVSSERVSAFCRVALRVTMTDPLRWCRRAMCGAGIFGSKHSAKPTATQRVRVFGLDRVALTAVEVPALGLVNRSGRDTTRQPIFGSVDEE